jgi:hypothetical protein
MVFGCSNSLIGGVLFVKNTGDEIVTTENGYYTFNDTEKMLLKFTKYRRNFMKREQSVNHRSLCRLSDYKVEGKT